MADDGMPAYIKKGSVEESHWRATHPQNKRSKRNSATTGSLQTVAHLAAQSGNAEQLEWEIKTNKDAVTAKDENGWTPLHEGARAGHMDVVKLLVENGADLNEKTGHGAGGTALYWAKKKLEPENPVIAYLESLGALESGPDL